MENNEREKEMSKDLQQANALVGLSLTEGGMLLTSNLMTDILSTIERLAVGYRTLSHTEMIALCANLDAQMGVLRAITRADTNKQFLEEELAKAIKQ